MRKMVFVLCLVAATPLLAQQDIHRISEPVRALTGNTYGNLSTVHGAIQVEAEARTGKLKAVNGAVLVGPQARVGGVETVNGDISLAELVQVAGDVGSTNGRIDIGPNTQIQGSLESTNGSITLYRAKVAGNVETVNGGITLRGAEVAGTLETTQGDIRVGRDSVLRGDIVVKRGRGLSIGKSKPPRVIIESGATVEGRLIFRRKQVELHMAEDAVVRHPVPVRR